MVQQKESLEVLVVAEVLLLVTRTLRHTLLLTLEAVEVAELTHTYTDHITATAVVVVLVFALYVT